jgi:hypothetical protein
MITLGGFVVGGVFAGIGVGVILNAYYLNSQMLFLGFWEQKFGTGTGTNGYQFFGLLLMILGTFSMIGILDLTANPIAGTTSSNNSSLNVPQISPINSGGGLIAE